MKNSSLSGGSTRNHSIILRFSSLTREPSQHRLALCSVGGGRHHGAEPQPDHSACERDREVYERCLVIILLSKWSVSLPGIETGGAEPSPRQP